MKLWRYILLACLLVSGCSSNLSASPTATSSQAPTAQIGTTTAIRAVPTAEVEQQIKTLWKQLDKGTPPAGKMPISWQQADSVLFPSEWPPTANTIWMRYLYGQGMDMENLRDAVRISAPWARVELRGNSNTITIVPLNTKLEPVDTQGVQPIDAATQAVLAKEDAVSAYCLSLTALPPANDSHLAEMRTFYRTWLKYNGAVVDLIRSNHATFLAWVNE